MSEYDMDFLAGFRDFSDHDEYYWEDFGDFPSWPLDRAESPIATSQYPQHQQLTTFTQTDSLDLPTYPRHNMTDDPFRPLSRNSDRQRSRASSHIIDLTDSPPLQMAKRKLTGAAATAHAAKKRRLSEQNSRPASRQATGSPGTKIETVDLTDMDQYESYTTKQKREKREKEALAAQMAKDEAQKSKKLAAMECAICLDNPTDLVITHCGHLFCSLCLHHALETGLGGARCPSCRTKVALKPTNERDKKLGFYSLEIKLKVSTKGGKKKA